MRLLIGLDDTDNKDSRGTGFKSRQLAHLIDDTHRGKVKGITRHQLFVHESIAYTSQNSSACLDVETKEIESIRDLCSNYLIREAAEGSDAGLCLIAWEEISETAIQWGRRAKCEVLSLDEARQIAVKWNYYLEGFTGKKIGQIGALAAVGLRKGGNDGRFIWLQGKNELRNFDAGTYSVQELRINAGIELVQTIDQKTIPDGDRVHCDGWTRPVLLKQKSVLFVEKDNFGNYEWKTIGKEYIRTIS